VKGGGDSGGEGQPLCMRGSTSGESEADSSGDEAEEWGLGVENFEDNLTFHEDSLSILKGTTTTPLGKDIPVWVTSDRFWVYDSVDPVDLRHSAEDGEACTP
jgi:hypothetical protein